MIMYNIIFIIITVVPGDIKNLKFSQPPTTAEIPKKQLNQEWCQKKKKHVSCSRRCFFPLRLVKPFLHVTENEKNIVFFTT